jgi:hypothetical protein
MVIRHLSLICVLSPRIAFILRRREYPATMGKVLYELMLQKVFFLSKVHAFFKI